MSDRNDAPPPRPMPRIDAVNRPFFDGCNDGRVVIQKCEAAGCGRHVYYPRVCCPHCHGARLAWVEVTGAGRIVSHTTVHRPHHPAFYPDAPYVFAAVRLDEGPIVYATVLDAPAEGSLTGRSVTPAFTQHTPHQKLLAFRLSPQD